MVTLYVLEAYFTGNRAARSDPWTSFRPFFLLDLDPLLWGPVSVSLVAGIVVSLCTAAPDRDARFEIVDAEEKPSCGGRMTNSSSDHNAGFPIPRAGASDLGRWMALAAALLRWLFDGAEMGLFSDGRPRPRFIDLLGFGTSPSKEPGRPDRVLLSAL